MNPENSEEALKEIEDSTRKARIAFMLGMACFTVAVVGALHQVFVANVSRDLAVIYFLMIILVNNFVWFLGYSEANSRASMGRVFNEYWKETAECLRDEVKELEKRLALTGKVMTQAQLDDLAERALALDFSLTLEEKKARVHELLLLDLKNQGCTRAQADEMKRLSKEIEEEENAS